MKREIILEEYYNTVGTNSVKARSLVKKLDYGEDHYLLQCIAQTYLDESIFENNGMMRISLDRRKWRIAERYIIRAFKINSDCANVLYTMGKVRKASGQTEIAIYCFKKIIQAGLKGLTRGRCVFAPDNARVLINDSKFELYRLYHEEKPDLSKRYLSMYKKGLDRGIRTIYKPLAKFLLK